MECARSDRRVAVALRSLIVAVMLFGTATVALGGTWKLVAAGRDCAGTDVGPCTAGSSIPNPVRCGEGSPATSAVCWDGATFRNLSGCNGSDPEGPWCTYKTTTAAECIDGANPGFLYECVDDPTAIPIMSTTGVAAMGLALTALMGAGVRRRLRSAEPV